MYVIPIKVIYYIIRCIVNKWKIEAESFCQKQGINGKIYFIVIVSNIHIYVPIEKIATCVQKTIYLNLYVRTYVLTFTARKSTNELNQLIIILS